MKVNFELENKFELDIWIVACYLMYISISMFQKFSYFLDSYLTVNNCCIYLLFEEQKHHKNGCSIIILITQMYIYRRVHIWDPFSSKSLNSMLSISKIKGFYVLLLDEGSSKEWHFRIDCLRYADKLNRQKQKKTKTQQQKP